VKCDFLRLHFFNELCDPFVRQLVGYSGHYPPIVIDLFVEFLALVTHRPFHAIFVPRNAVRR
jgi:hypothetical protein